MTVETRQNNSDEMWKYLFCSSFVQKMSLAERWESLLKKVIKDFGGLNIFEIIFQPLALAIHFPSFPPLLIPQRPLPSQSRLLGPGSTQPFNIALCKGRFPEKKWLFYWILSKLPRQGEGLGVPRGQGVGLLSLRGSRGRPLGIQGIQG